MVLSYLLDENLRGPLWRALQQHNARGQPFVDVVRVGDVANLPLGTPDPDILLWAEREGRILVSFDKDTLAGHLETHLQAGHASPGIFTMRRHTTIPEVVEFLALAAYASEPSEWRDRIEFIG